MRLIIGGFAQGKLEWLRKQQFVPQEKIADGENCTLQEAVSAQVLNHLHLFIRGLLKEQKDARQIIAGLIDQNPDLIIICDEIGGGIVPIDAFERLWREETGRICCTLAQKAQRVDRVFCGVGTVIKQNEELQK